MSTITVTKTAEDIASRVLQVTVPVPRVQEAEDRAVRQYAKRVRLPGFRPGKAPEAVVRKRLAEEIRQAVLQDLLREGWDAAQQVEALKPIADPSVRNLKFEPGQPIEFEIVVEVRPELTLERLGGFTLTRTVAPVEDAAVQEQLDRLREQKASWLPVEGEKPVPGHLALGDVAPIEGETVHAAKPFTLTLGSGQAVPALEEQLLDMRPGETRDADIRFPEDDADESRRGQSRRVRITLREVKRQELPPLDDAFAKEVGDFETVDALRAALRADLAAEAERDADAKVREQLISQIAGTNSVVAPPTMVERALAAFAYAYQIPEAQFQAFAEQFQPIAARQVQRDLILGTVAEQAGLRATEAELDERIAAIAAARGASPAEVYKSLEEAKRLPELERSLTEEKVFAHLLAQSTITS